MPRPVPTPLYHFTSIHHLASLIERGLVCDNGAAAGLLAAEVGNRGIKERRRRRAMPVSPRGVIADYVLFYFAPRSPMLYAITMGNVPEYTGSIDLLLYLVTTAERLAELGLPMLFTDRNAVLTTAHFTPHLADLDTLIDWPLMRATMARFSQGIAVRTKRDWYFS